MTYNETIEYIESLAVFGSKPGFQRIEALTKALGNPEKDLNIIHVAGTNGKGSVCNETCNILEAAGYKTGLFSSPYVSDFRERIQIGGSFINKDFLCSLTEVVKKETENLKIKEIQPTEFEFLTALAFLAFKEANVDYVVLETGLGGLLDSTNIIKEPIVTAITSLSMDHTNVLGETIEEIAFQKAGILKENVPVISACNQPEAALKVLKEEAKKKNCSLKLGKTDEIKRIKSSLNGQELTIKGEKLRLPLYGDHQIVNLGITLEIINELNNQGINITWENIKEGLEKTTLPGRIEVLCKDPVIIIDGGHNEAGVTVLKDAIENMELKNLTIVTGVMKDKETEKMAEIIKPLAKRIITVTPSVPRAMDSKELKNIFLTKKPKDIKVISIDNPLEGINYGLNKKDNLLISGSLYLAGEVRNQLISIIDNKEN